MVIIDIFLVINNRPKKLKTTILRLMLIFHLEKLMLLIVFFLFDQIFALFKVE
jgi:hypothetical protein